jgi:hypothetical protein
MVRVLLVFVANKSAEIRAAHPDWVMTQHIKPWLDFQRLHGRPELVGKLRKPLFWCPGRGENAEPSIGVNVLVTELGDRRHVRQGVDPLL